jgi:predicted lipoprotein
MNGKVSSGLAVAIGAVAIFVVVALLFGFTVVSTEEEEAANVEFDPALYVDGAFDNIRSTIKDGAVDLAAILQLIEPDTDGNTPKEDLAQVVEQYGLVTAGDAHVYEVIATGTVTDVDVASSKGTLGLQVEGYEGPIEVRAYVGRRIPSDDTSIRDATGLIAFGDFKDQTEYGKVASEINKRVVADLSKVDAESLLGKEVQITGTLMMRTQNRPEIPGGQLFLVPIEIVEP